MLLRPVHPKQICSRGRERCCNADPRSLLSHCSQTALQVLAKELIHTRKVTTRLYTNKAHMMSMNSQLTEQLGMVKVAGTLKKSTQVWAGVVLGSRK